MFLPIRQLFLLLISDSKTDLCTLARTVSGGTVQQAIRGVFGLHVQRNRAVWKNYVLTFGCKKKKLVWLNQEQSSTLK